MIKRIINKKSAYALNSFSFYATAEISTTDETYFTLITSEYWLNKEELVLSEFEGNCLLSEDEEDKNQ